MTTLQSSVSFKHPDPSSSLRAMDHSRGGGQRPQDKPRPMPSSEWQENDPSPRSSHSATRPAGPGGGHGSAHTAVPASAPTEREAEPGPWSQRCRHLPAALYSDGLETSPRSLLCSRFRTRAKRCRTGLRFALS